MGTFNEDPIHKELNLTEGEEALLAGAETGSTAQINKTRIYATIYSAKRLRAAIDDLITSNEKLSTSNDRYAKAMNWLTFGLLLVAIIQGAVQIVISLFAR